MRSTRWVGGSAGRSCAYGSANSSSNAPHRTALMRPHSPRRWATRRATSARSSQAGGARRVATSTSRARSHGASRTRCQNSALRRRARSRRRPRHPTRTPRHLQARPRKPRSQTSRPPPYPRQVSSPTTGSAWPPSSRPRSRRPSTPRRGSRECCACRCAGARALRGLHARRAAPRCRRVRPRARRGALCGHAQPDRRRRGSARGEHNLELDATWDGPEGLAHAGRGRLPRALRIVDARARARRRGRSPPETQHKAPRCPLASPDPDPGSRRTRSARRPQGVTPSSRRRLTDRSNGRRGGAFLCSRCHQPARWPKKNRTKPPERTSHVIVFYGIWPDRGGHKTKFSQIIRTQY